MRARYSGSIWRSLGRIFSSACVICWQPISATGRFPDCCPRCASELPFRDIDLTCLHFRPKVVDAAARRGIYCLIPCFYQGSLNHLLRQFKFHDMSNINTFLGSLLTDLLRRRCSPERQAAGYVLTPELGHWRDIDLVVPIPLHPKRMRERGYNQAYLLAAQISFDLGLELNSRILLRCSATARQTKQGSAQARWLNVQSAFETTATEPVRGKNILLVDDITTTGSTLIVAAEALLVAGARSVTGIVVASEH